MKIVFMGTPDFAVASLDILIKNGFDVVAVITATDKLGGRGGKQVLQSGVKQYAVAHSLPVLQPEKLKNPEFIDILRGLEADLFVVVAFRMLPEIVWTMPPLGTINVHGSLLPKYRGAAPINWAVINGEKETGVTTFFLKHEIDTGDIIFREKLPIGEDEIVGEIHDKMMILGAETVLKTVQSIDNQLVTYKSQLDILATHASKIFTETCEIDFEKTTADVHNFVRGLSPYPTAWTVLEGLKLKVFRTSKEMTPPQYETGKLVSDGKSYLKIACSDGFVHLLDIQLEGRKRMLIRDFLNGYNVDRHLIAPTTKF